MSFSIFLFWIQVFPPLTIISDHGIFSTYPMHGLFQHSSNVSYIVSQYCHHALLTGIGSQHFACTPFCWNWQVVRSCTLLIDVLRTTYCSQNNYITCDPSHICYDSERGSFPYCLTSLTRTPCMP